MSKSPFNKKKIPFDFSDNAMMISSVRALSRPSKDEAYLSLQRELKKMKKSNNDLIEKYEEMKDYSISQTVQLQLNLSQANNRIFHLQQEKQMLLARIKCLEKESISMTKSYQRPLNRSLIKSTLKMSTLNSQNHCQCLNQRGRLAPKTERSEDSQTSLDQMLRTKRNLSFNESELNDLSFVQDSSLNVTKFDKKEKEKRPLISQNLSQEEPSFCGNKRCLKNYEELQQLRDSLSNLTKQLQGIYLKIQFQVQNRMSEKNMAAHKQNLQDLLKQVSGIDFFYKGKTAYFLAKIEQKVKDFTKTQAYKNSNPTLTKIKEKIEIIKKEEKDLRQEFICESYDEDFGLKQTERLSKVIHKQYKIVSEMMKKKGIQSEKFDKLYKEHEKSRKIDWKLSICEDSDSSDSSDSSEDNVNQ